MLVSALKALSDGAAKKSSTLLEVLAPLLRSSCSVMPEPVLEGINRRKHHLRSVHIKHGRGCKNGRPPAVGRDMRLTRKVRKGLAGGWEPHIRRMTLGRAPTRAIVLTVEGEGLPISELLQKKVAVLHVWKIGV